MLTRYAFLLLILLLATAGCDTEDEPSSAQVGQVFVLGGGQEVTVEPAGLRLTFSEVLQDSRCPTQVQCVEAGQALIRLTAELGEEAPVDLEFNTNEAPGMTQLTRTVGGYLVELQGLDPYPENPQVSIDLDEYEASLLVTSIEGAGPNN